MSIVHPGNFQGILSPRCSIDSIKYSRNKRKFVVDFETPSERVPLNSTLEFNANLQSVNLDNGLILFISYNPHSWFIADSHFEGSLNDLKRKEYNSPELDQETINLLYRKGLLRVDGESLDTEELSGRYSVRSDNVALISITDRCNLNCEHCVANANRNKLCGKELSLTELSNIFRCLSQEENPYGLDVERKVFISGGEPLIRRDLGDIALACANEGLSTHVCTNGLRVNQDLLSKLKDKGIAFSVSLDGERENHEFVRGNGTFETTIRNIRYMRERGFDVFLNTFLHQGNMIDMDYLLNFGAENGIMGINFIRAIPRGRGKDMKFKRVPDRILFRKIYDLMKQDKKFYEMLEDENTFPVLATSAMAGIKSLNCGLSRGNYFFLDSVGSVYPCPGTRYAEFLIGNIRELEMKEILERRKTHPLSDLRVDEFPICSSCEFQYFCGGDCRGSAYGNSTSKDIKSPVPYCSERRDSLKEMFRILGNDPNFLRNKSEWIVQNAKEETRRRN